MFEECDASRVHVGDVDVDAGRVWIGDPCYVLGAGAWAAPRDWTEFCARLDDPASHVAGLGGKAAEPLGRGVGVAVSSGGGDGSYPVFVTVLGDGRVASVTVQFIAEMDDEDDVLDWLG